MTPDGGFLLLWRKLFEHDYWKEKRVFSRAEAFIDCWGNLAAFDDHKRIVGGRRVTVRRGQFVASDRFLERRWKWSRSKVRRFIQGAIVGGELVRVRTVNGWCSKDDTAGGTIYAVVNYELYQPRDTASDTALGPRRDRVGAKDKQDKARETNKKPNMGPRWRVCPESWKGPNEKHRELAAKHGLDVEVEAMKFRAHEYDRPKTDPDRTFTSWLLKAAEFRARRNGNGRPASMEEATARVIEFRRSLDELPLNGTHD
jgi:hypothetical protein